MGIKNREKNKTKDFSRTELSGEKPPRLKENGLTVGNLLELITTDPYNGSRPP